MKINRYNSDLPAGWTIFEGDLYRGNDCVRVGYAAHRRAIETVADFKATLRAGPYAWPGGYALFFITSDGQPLSFRSAEAEAGLIIDAIRNRDNSGWRVVACGVDDDDDEYLPTFCCHDSKPIDDADLEEWETTGRLSRKRSLDELCPDCGERLNDSDLCPACDNGRRNGQSIGQFV